MTAGEIRFKLAFADPMMVNFAEKHALLVQLKHPGILWSTDHYELSATSVMQAQISLQIPPGKVGEDLRQVEETVTKAQSYAFTALGSSVATNFFLGNGINLLIGEL